MKQTFTVWQTKKSSRTGNFAGETVHPVVGCIETPEIKSSLNGEKIKTEWGMATITGESRCLVEGDQFGGTYYPDSICDIYIVEN